MVFKIDIPTKFTNEYT